jgi:hypothetical protein
MGLVVDMTRSSRGKLRWTCYVSRGREREARVRGEAVCTSIEGRDEGRRSLLMFMVLQELKLQG